MHRTDIFHGMAEQEFPGADSLEGPEGAGKSTNRDYLAERLRSEGIEVYAFLHVKFPLFTSKVNYRNHRKIAVIDGCVGFLGGMNIADRYVRGTQWGTWRDTHFRIEGSGAAGLQASFLSDWSATTKQQIAALFEEKIPDTPYTEDVDALIAIGRRVLRDQFRDAPIGVSGVNFMVADTGTLVLVENEGNGRMCTTVPKVHIAITGIEKVVEKLEHVAPLFSILTRSATGQAVSTYFNMISGPRRGDDRDGPQEVHLVLLDNGRSQAYADEQLRQTLQCIRCGACMNHCPVYTRIGGHAYGTTYPGPIGKIVSPHMMGLEQTHLLPTASSLCGACGEVCPVKIPIPELLIRLRGEAQSAPHANPAMVGQGAGYDAKISLLWKLWARLYGRPATYRAFTWLATRFRFLTPKQQSGWTAARTPLKPAPRRLRDMVKDRR